jgi:hypothetical protein
MSAIARRSSEAQSLYKGSDYHDGLRRSERCGAHRRIPTLPSVEAGPGEGDFFEAQLPPRHRETLLQGLVHAKILKGRGPRGGYELAPERDQISVGEIVRTALALSTSDPAYTGSHSKLLGKVIEPQVRRVGEPFLANLDAITVEQLSKEAERAHIH